MNFLSSRLSLSKAILLLDSLLILCGCNVETARIEDTNDVLMTAGDKSISLKDVISKIPVGLEPSDSAAMFQLIVDNWIKTVVLSDLAKRKLPDFSEIERKVEDYRNRLIVKEYINEMKKGMEFNIKADSIKKFYELHKNEMVTETPLVKGIYLKVATNQSNLEEIKRLVFCGNDECVDKLEKTSAGDAIQYDYFMNNWVDWQTIADQIPYRFYDPDAFLKSTNNFETTFNGSTYILHISEFLPSGSEPPYEFAAIQIKELLERTDMKKYEESLVRSMIRKAINDGDLVIGSYNPMINH